MELEKLNVAIAECEARLRDLGKTMRQLIYQRELNNLGQTWDQVEGLLPGKVPGSWEGIKLKTGAVDLFPDAIESPNSDNFYFPQRLEIRRLLCAATVPVDSVEDACSGRDVCQCDHCQRNRKILELLK